MGSPSLGPTPRIGKPNAAYTAPSPSLGRKTFITPRLVIFLKDGQLESVLSDSQSEITCLMVQACAEKPPQITGEPWVKPVRFPSGEKTLAVLEAKKIEFNPQTVGDIFFQEALWKKETGKLLD